MLRLFGILAYIAVTMFRVDRKLTKALHAKTIWLNSKSQDHKLQLIMHYISTFLVSHQALPSSDDRTRTTVSNYKNWLRNVYEFDMYGMDSILLGPMSDGIGQ
jgi:hypothetical protein